MGEHFSKYVSVMGVHVFATAETSDAKLLHAAKVLAEYLDNDEDGVADDPDVLSEMLANRATLVMFSNYSQADSSGVFDDERLDELWLQDLYADETNPGYPSSTSDFDYALEEVLHLVTSSGWSSAYPAAVGEAPGSALTDAMDLARGGHFEESAEDDCEGNGQCALPPGGQYPADAWYSYDDPTCDYRCMATEYLYWTLTSLLGGQQAPGRPEEIDNEWRLPTPGLLATGDPAVHTLLTASGYATPTVLPDGGYQATSFSVEANPCLSVSQHKARGKCRKEVRKQVSKYATATLKAWQKCIDGVNRGKLEGHCPDTKSQAKLQRFELKVGEGIVKRCTDAQVASLDATSVFGGSCSGATTTDVIASCEITEHEAATDTLLGLVP